MKYEFLLYLAKVMILRDIEQVERNYVYLLLKEQDLTAYFFFPENHKFWPRSGKKGA